MATNFLSRHQLFEVRQDGRTSVDTLRRRSNDTSKNVLRVMSATSSFFLFGRTTLTLFPLNGWTPQTQVLPFEFRCYLVLKVKTLKFTCRHPGANLACLLARSCFRNAKTCLHVWKSMLGDFTAIAPFKL